MNIQLPSRNFGGYIFDCDGTLADSMPVHFLAWNQVLAESGKSFPEALFYSWGGKTTVHVVECLNKEFGWELDIPETAHRKENYYVKLIPQIQPIMPVVELAHALYGKAPLAVASGGYRDLVVATLEILGIERLFDAIVCAEDCPRGKPAPDPFLEAARRMNIPPTDCLVFEDSPTGAAAAAAAGMECVLVEKN